MAISLVTTWRCLLLFLGGDIVFLAHGAPPPSSSASGCAYIPITDADRGIITGGLNLEYLEAELFLGATFGYGLDKFASEFSDGGPRPIGVQRANLEDAYYMDIFKQIGLQEIGHIRLVKATLGADYSFPRPLINLSRNVWAKIMDLAFESALDPPFNPYTNSLNFLLMAYTIPYIGVTTFAGAIQDIVGSEAKLLVTKLLAIEAGQDAIIRTELYRRKDEKVMPYNYTATEFTTAISNLRNKLCQDHIDEGIVVPLGQGANGMISGNILIGDEDSATYIRTPAQFFSTLYLSGNASRPGGFYPNGASGALANSYLNPKPPNP